MANEETILSPKACSGLANSIRDNEVESVRFNNKTLIKEKGNYHIPDVTIRIGSMSIKGKLSFPDRDLGIHLIAFYSMTKSKTKEEAQKWYDWAKERVKDDYYLVELEEILSGDVPSDFNP